MKDNYVDEKIDVSKEVNFIWSIANSLRGPYKSDKYKGTEGNIVSKKMLDYCGVKYRQYEEKNIEVKLEL